MMKKKYQYDILVGNVKGSQWDLAGKHSEKEATLHKVRAENVQESSGNLRTTKDSKGSWKMLQEAKGC